MSDGSIAIDGQPVAAAASSIGAEDVPDLSPLAQDALRRLLRVWIQFERDLVTVPILRRLDLGTYTLADHRRLLLNMRQQVIEGSRWIARAASSMDRDHSALRSLVLRHAVDEHRDYSMLEQDYVAAGGDLATIQERHKNVGSEAFHGFMMHRASQPNPVDMLGAMWIIEGLGERMASGWSARMEELCEREGITRFMAYHGENDGDHMQKFYAMLDDVCTDEDVVRRIETTAKVVARLYRLQLEEVDDE